MGEESRFVLLCVLTGIFAGLLAIGFHVGIRRVFQAAWALGGALGEGHRAWLMPLIPAVGGLLVGLCVSTFAKSAAGSGIPQTKARFYNDFGIFRAREIVYRFFLGILFCGSGNSAGREGPTVHLCAATGSILAQKLGFAKPRVQNAVPIGMGAGIAASFNAPLSAMTFVFEELLGGFRGRGFAPMVLAVVIAAAIARLLLGENPILPMPFTDYRTGAWMLVALPLGAAAGLTGHLFLKGLLRLRGAVRARKHLPAWCACACGGLFTGVLGMLAFSATGRDAVFSVGYQALLPAFDGEIALRAMAMLFVFKFCASLVNYAMGGSGGLFSPTLVIGGMLGGTIAAAGVALFGLDASVVGAGVLLGMGACFAAIIRCPVTSVLIIFELTLNYSLILPLLAGNLIAFLIARKLQPVGLYDALLLQDGISLKQMPAYRSSRDWAALPVGAIATYEPHCLRADWSLARAREAATAAPRPFRTYPVLDGDDKFLGLLRAADLHDAAHAPAMLCGALAPRLLHDRLRPETSIRDAANFMADRDLEDVAVVGARGALVAILSLHDIVRRQNAAENN